MTWVAAAVVGSAVVGAAASSYSARRGASAQTRASRDAIGAQQESEARALDMQRPFLNAGYQATAALMDMSGLGRSSQSSPDIFNSRAYLDANPDVAASQYFVENPEEHYERYGRAEGRQAEYSHSPDNLSGYEKYDWKTDPGYEFRFDEGQRALERSRAAGGLLNSGGTGRALVRYGQNVASEEYSKVYDRIARIAGFGGSAATQGSQTIVNTGQNVGNALINAGEARASGYVAQGNAWSNSLNQVGMYYGSRNA